MISGQFSEQGELIFEIELVAVNGEQIAVDVLLDTGFTTGFLAIHADDLEALDWSVLAAEVEMQTARGIEYFDIYEGRTIVDGKEFIIPVHVGAELTEILLGRQWLRIMKLVIDESKGILTLEYVGG
jgi:predicted aspartyl protease